MPSPSTLTELEHLLTCRPELLSSGRTDQELAQLVRNTDLVRVSLGRYIRASEWARLDERDRHLLRIISAHQAATRPPLFSHVSAAVLLGLPLVHANLDRVHTLAPAGTRPSSRAQLARHHADHEPVDEVTVAGLRCTDAIRTVIDLARSSGFETGLVCSDAVLRELTKQRGESEEAKARMLDRLARLPRGNGCRRAERVLQFASPFAESPLETLTRLQLVRLGFQVREQVAVPGPNGQEFRLDFELEGCDTFLEADGRVKYTDPAMRNGSTADEIVYQEKRREDWVRGTTGRRVIRTDWTDARSPAAMAERLRAFGIAPPAWPPRRHRGELY